jgi:DNA-binding CsgD family transcriptional regulator
MVALQASSQALPSTLTNEDMGRVIRLLGQSTVPGDSLPCQRRKLCAALANLVDADIWVWTHAQTDGQSDGAAYAMMDEGWSSPEQKGRFLNCINRPYVAQKIVIPMLESYMVDGVTHATCRRVDIIPDAYYYNSEFHADCLSHTGLDDLIVTAKLLPHRRISTLSMHRHAGRQRFTERDRDIVHLVTSEVPWLHSRGHNVPATNATLRLSARLRSVLLLLLSGDSRKQIATRLEISEHTLSDYIKAIHRHYKVNSRNELVARFITGQQTLQERSNPTGPLLADERDFATLTPT